MTLSFSSGAGIAGGFVLKAWSESPIPMLPLLGVLVCGRACLGGLVGRVVGVLDSRAKALRKLSWCAF